MLGAFLILLLLVTGCQSPEPEIRAQSAAEAVLADFHGHGLPIGQTRMFPVQTFRDGYSGRLDFRDTRLAPTVADKAPDWTADGGLIEVYPSRGSAISRRDALIARARQNGLPVERVYVSSVFVMQLSPRFTSEQANQYEAILREMVQRPT